MPEFRHTVVACGPHHELLLQHTECCACLWQACGSTSALLIAEQAHHCGSRREMPANLPGNDPDEPITSTSGAPICFLRH